MDASAAKQHQFAELTRPLAGDLYRYAFWLCRDSARAEDLVQEALLRGWRAFDTLRDEKAAKHWFLTILRREHAREFERRQLEMISLDQAGPLRAEAENPDIVELRRALFELDIEYREPLVLQVLMGYSTEEIGQLMGLKRGAVLTRLFRARKKLKEVLSRSTVT